MSAVVVQLPLPKRRKVANRIALTEQRVSDLKPRAQTYYANDTRMPGLSVRVTHRGVKSYVFTRKVNGRLLRITLGKADALTLEAARKAAAVLNGDIAKQVDIVATRKAVRTQAAQKALTLADAFAAFKSQKQRRPSTLSDYETVWRLHIPDALKRRAVEDIQQSDIEKLRTSIGKSKERTANKVVVLLAAIMNRSGRRGDNPARDVKRFDEKVRTRRLTQGELSGLWAALSARAGELWADFFRIMVLTGARRGALCAMRWQDIDLPNGVWAVPAIWSKNKREIAVPLTAIAVDILGARWVARGPNAGPWVWPSEQAAGGHVVNPEKPWRAFLKAAAITERATLHDVRRTLGSSLAKSGAPSATITKALGHVSPQSARAYVHLDVETARDAIEKALGASLK